MHSYDEPQLKWGWVPGENVKQVLLTQLLLNNRCNKDYYYYNNSCNQLPIWSVWDKRQITWFSDSSFAYSSICQFRKTKIVKHISFLFFVGHRESFASPQWHIEPNRLPCDNHGCLGLDHENWKVVYLWLGQGRHKQLLKVCKMKIIKLSFIRYIRFNVVGKGDLMKVIRSH